MMNKTGLEGELCRGRLFRYLGYINKVFSQQIEIELQKQGFDDFQISNIWLLILIERFPNYTMNELAQVVNQSRANISIISKKLVQKGYVVKVHPENNKKVIYLAPTEKWLTLKPIVFMLLDELDQKIEGTLSELNYEKLLSDLEKIVVFFKSESKPFNK